MKVHSREIAQSQRDLLIVVLLALVVRTVFALAISPTYDYDEFVILLLSRDYAHGAVPYRDFMFFHPPGALVVFGLLNPLTELWWPVARILPLMIDCLTVALVWRLADHLYGRRAAAIAAVLYCLSPLALVTSARVGQDSLITALEVGGLLLLVVSAGRKSAIAAGLCVALAVWIKVPALLFLPVYLLAAPRRAGLILLSALLGEVALIAPFYLQAHQIYDQIVTFQSTRWTMPFDQRLTTLLVYWIVINPLALLSSVFGRHPRWIRLAYWSGIVFAVSPQVYYHYFAPIVPVAAILASPLVAKFPLPSRRIFAASMVIALAVWAAAIDFGGASPVYVRAAHLSDVEPTLALLRAHTSPGSAVLADRYEYAFLANRRAAAHYFWNVGVLIEASTLEREATGSAAAVLSSGASSGYPTGFVAYLNRRFRRTATPDTTVWLAGRCSTCR